MKAATQELTNALNRKIDETLARYQTEHATTSDGFNIIRWAAKGWLQRIPDAHANHSQ